MLILGEKLKEERLIKNLSLEDVSKSTKIKEVFLECIENGEYEKLPSSSYAHGFVRNYIKFLKLPEKEMMALFRREFDEEKAYSVLPKGLDRTQEFSLSGFKIRQTAVIIFIIFIIFLGYILFAYRYAFLNPPLKIITPKNGSVILTSEIRVLGKTDSNSTVYIDKIAVSVDSSGNFEKTITVFPGKSVINIEVINKFLRKTDKQIEVNVKPGS